VRIGFTEPARLREAIAVLGDEGVQLSDEIFILGQLLERLAAGVLQNQPWIVGLLPEFGGNMLPEGVGDMAPGPAQVEGKFSQAGQ
jgi:hypothetical protein